MLFDGLGLDGVGGPGYQPTHLDFNPTEQALAHVQERNNDRVGYGDYRNTYFISEPLQASDLNLGLFPDNLQSIYELQYLIWRALALPTRLSPSPYSRLIDPEFPSRGVS